MQKFYLILMIQGALAEEEYTDIISATDGLKSAAEPLQLSTEISVGGDYHMVRLWKKDGFTHVSV